VNRREAIGVLAGAAVGTVSAGGAHAAEAIATRPFARSGERVSMVGLGGHHIGRPKDPAEGVRLIRTAVDRGITFLDNCWDYNDGESERRMGDALQDGYRRKVFLMTKFDGRTRKSAAEQIDESLRRLRTDHVDLMQYHENIRMEDPDRFFAADGPLEALRAAQKAGKIRFIGFTGHKDPAVHLRMLDIAAAHDFHFDACQLPLNVMDAHFRSFEREVLPRLVKEGVAVLGMKPMGDGFVLKSGVVTAVECLHYALNLPATTVITGCESMELLDQAVGAARSFRPLSQKAVDALLARTKSLAMTGRFEPFKTTEMFDGTAHNPQWMG